MPRALIFCLASFLIGWSHTSYAARDYNVAINNEGETYIARMTYGLARAYLEIGKYDASGNLDSKFNFLAGIAAHSDDLIDFDFQIVASKNGNIFLWCPASGELLEIDGSSGLTLHRDAIEESYYSSMIAGISNDELTLAGMGLSNDELALAEKGLSKFQEIKFDLASGSYRVESIDLNTVIPRDGQMAVLSQELMSAGYSDSETIYATRITYPSNTWLVANLLRSPDALEFKRTSNAPFGLPDKFTEVAINLKTRQFFVLTQFDQEFDYTQDESLPPINQVLTYNVDHLGDAPATNPRVLTGIKSSQLVTTAAGQTVWFVVHHNRAELIPLTKGKIADSVIIKKLRAKEYCNEHPGVIVSGSRLSEAGKTSRRQLSDPGEDQLLSM